MLVAVRFLGSGSLPSFRGTTLRGAFGYALKDTVCALRRQECGTCLCRSRCAFPNVFEGVPPPARTFMRNYPYVPQPFVMRVVDRAKRDIHEGDTEEFGIRCFGPASELYPYVLMAVIEMGQRGLGRDQIAFAVTGVSDGEKTIYDAACGGELQNPTRRTAAHSASANGAGSIRLDLEYLTPTRIRTEGRTNRLPDLPAIIRAAYRRLRILDHFYGDGDSIPEDVSDMLAVAEQARPLDSSVRPYTINRRSTRQQTDMALDGVVGRASYELPDASLVPWLSMAEDCHIGKATSFGFGRIHCTVSHP